MEGSVKMNDYTPRRMPCCNESMRARACVRTSIRHTSHPLIVFFLSRGEKIIGSLRARLSCWTASSTCMYTDRCTGSAPPALIGVVYRHAIKEVMGGRERGRWTGRQIVRTYREEGERVYGQLFLGARIACRQRRWICRGIGAEALHNTDGS